MIVNLFGIVGVFLTLAGFIGMTAQSANAAAQGKWMFGGGILIIVVSVFAKFIGNDDDIPLGKVAVAAVLLLVPGCVALFFR